MTPAISAATLSLSELEAKFTLQESTDSQFFREWQDNLPEIGAWEKESLDRLKAGYLNLIKKPPLLENAVRTTILDPLLFIAGFYLSPFTLKLEQSIQISLADDENTVIEGRIDILVLKEQFWVLVIESKRAAISLDESIAQLLTYMLATPNPEQPIFGMLTNGGHFLFIKLVLGETPKYALSNEFGLRRQENELYTVLRVLKKLIQL